MSSEPSNVSSDVNSTVDQCYGLSCVRIHAPLVGLTMLPLCLFFLATNAFSFYLMLKLRLYKETPISILMLSHLGADVLRLLSLLYGACTFISNRIIFFPSKYQSWVVLMFGGIAYQVQINHHLIISTNRLVVTLSRSPVVGTKWCTIEALGCWIVGAGALVTHMVLTNTLCYYDPVYGYESFVYPEKADSRTSYIYYSVMEFGVAGAGLLGYIICFLVLNQRRRQVMDSSKNRTIQKQDGYVAEYNILIICGINVVLQVLNALAWRYVGFSFNYTDSINSGSGGILNLLLVHQMRKKAQLILTCRRDTATETLFQRRKSCFPPSNTATGTFHC